VLGIMIVVLIGLNLTYLGKKEGLAYALPGFYGLMAFVGIAMAILLARVFARLARREEDYYRARSVDSEPWPSDELDMGDDRDDV